jgi:antitoxin CptB|tara:strand:+ start:3092 stop:3358 length:267 start_codon:yes stop_codon:yes gene_type:complete
MNIDIDNLKKRILYRSQYRGTREMDKLLYSFVLKNINKMDKEKLFSLEKFLDIDDEKLYKFYNNTDENLKFEDKYILNLFKKFKLDAD